jgi:hypothetical protein
MSITFGDSGSGQILEVTLASGRSISCWKCIVAYTYEGFMIRTPSEQVNEIMLRAARRDAERLFGDWPVHILHPERRPDGIDYPPVRVIAEFTSSPMDKEMHLSSLVIAWFQSSHSPLVGDEVRDQLIAIDWESLAVDYET